MFPGDCVASVGFYRQAVLMNLTMKRQQRRSAVMEHLFLAAPDVQDCITVLARTAIVSQYCSMTSNLNIDLL